MSDWEFPHTPSFEALSNSIGQKDFTEEEFLKDASKIIAFYLPQYHEVVENSEWWGPGFTDWVNVAKAEKLFADHYQPQIPQELGFYDLTNPQVLERQAKLAGEHGVYGFCFYWYWFNGRRILEKPITILKDSNIDLNYCICWANHSWARTWDHNPKEILIEQSYLPGFEDQFIDDILQFWKDDRYIRVDERPLLLIYRVMDLPDPVENIKRMRDSSRSKYGLNPYIVGVDFYDIDESNTYGLDALVEFPPHKFWSAANEIPKPDSMSTGFLGKFIDYNRVVLQSLSRKMPDDVTIFRTLFPSWDNTARLGNRSVIIQNTDPRLFGRWLAGLRQSNRQTKEMNQNFIFINAWNEWAEGAHLEPDLKNGRQFLEEILKTQIYKKNFDYLNTHSFQKEIGMNHRIKKTQVYFSTSYYLGEDTKTRKMSIRIYNLSPYLYSFLRKMYVLFIALPSKNFITSQAKGILFNISPHLYRLLRKLKSFVS
jgi:lipopolysaccharide biosynthesis protein